jgi:uncharacterized protein (DUF58 family)
MIYPTRMAVLISVIGAPVTLLVAMLISDRWFAAIAWPAMLLVLTIIDALLGPSPRAARARLELPRKIGVGEPLESILHVSFAGKGPRAVQLSLDSGPLLVHDDAEQPWLDLSEGQGAGEIPLRAVRRGTAHIDQVWLRWRGTFGLVWKQRRIDLNAKMAILPDVRPVRERGARIFERHALQGLVAQLHRGDGSDFDALVEFRAGMDRNTIDWKQSARHLKLFAKEYHSERNNQIVFAVDSGRQMSEPIAGLARLDRVVSAMLLTAWVALKLGDRVALNSFDSRPRVASGLVSGTAAFSELQSLAAQIDYSGDETNYSYALANLSARLTRRSMIVLFTEFTDLTSADFLVRAVARLVETHLLLVVVLRDDELETLRDAAPQTADDVTRAVTAAALLRDRLMVLTRLRHLGVHVVESEYDRVPDRLVEAYVDLKNRNLL